MKKITALIIMAGILLSGCMAKDNLSIDEAEESSLYAEIIVSETSKEEAKGYINEIEILPDKDNLPDEIIKVFYEDKEFTYLPYLYETPYDSNVVYERYPIRTDIKHFNYYSFIELTRAGNIIIDEWYSCWKEYVIQDLDNDGMNELIYYLKPDYYIIFHVIDGDVYAYSLLSNELYYVFKDGTIEAYDGESGDILYKIESFSVDGFTKCIIGTLDFSKYLLNGDSLCKQEFYDYYDTNWGDDFQVEWVSADDETEAESEEPEIYQSIVEIIPDTENLPAEISDVFYNDTEFIYLPYLDEKPYTIDEGQKRYLIRTSIRNFTYIHTVEKTNNGDMDLNEWDAYWKRYAIQDLDNDGINELIYLVDDYFYIIFHVIDGEVYGYSKLYREMDHIYKDGTIEAGAGADGAILYRIQSFEKDSLSETIIAELEYTEHRINGEEVTEAEFLKYISAWDSSNKDLVVEWISSDE